MMRFLKDDRGSFATFVGIALVPMMAVSGVAVDYSRMSTTKVRLQSAADTAALAGAAATDAAAAAKVTDMARTNVAGSVNGATMSSRWLSPTDFEVTATGSVKGTLTSAVPGIAKSMNVSVRSVARLYQPVVMSQAPTVNQLDPEAGDYNQISAYCYNQSKKSDPTTKGRTQVTPIADNGGTTYAAAIPTCGQGEVLSYKLRNVRNMRTTPSRWNDPTAEQYEYFTDTTLEGYKQTFNLGNYDIVETIICSDLSVCKPQSQGGIIPAGKDRTPQTMTGTCDPGKYLYMGWEDRPPGYGWTDRDYDDIRIIVACPSLSKGAKQVYLIR